MRGAIAIVAVLSLAAVAGPARAQERPRFRHDAHFALAGWNGLLGCAWCHNAPESDKKGPEGKLIHTRCNAEGCHATDFEDADTRICLACHQEKTRVPAKAMAMIPFPREATFFAELSHKKHLTGKPAAKLTDSCKDCHASKEKRPSHDNCGRVECHGGAESRPPMTSCDACHKPLFDAAGARAWSGPRRNLGRCRVTSFFSHFKHEERKATCGECHLSVATADRLGDLVATNGGRTMEKACGQCHNGKRSFSTKGTCTSCHTNDCVVEGP